MADTESELICIGIDSSTVCTGISIVSLSNKKEKLLGYTKVYTDKNQSFQEKCLHIYSKISEFYLLYKDRNPIFAIELLNSQKNMDTTRKLAGLWGFITTSLLRDFKISTHSLNTGTVKKIATGDGSADKQKVIRYINKLFTLKLKYSDNKKLSDDDIADAIAVAICALRLSSKGQLKNE